MKAIKIYVIHPKVTNVDSFLEYFSLQDLKDKFNFIWDSTNPDYLFATELIYGQRKSFNEFKKLYPIARIKIFWASEAITPDFNIFDYAIGWDVNLNFGDRFAMLPPTMVYPAKHFINAKENTIRSEMDALEELQCKKHFCSFLYSNANAHPMRDRLFYKISEYKFVHSLGKHLNNVNQKGTGYEGHRKECVEIKRDYKFSVSSENAEFSGYTSEKLLTSFCAHSIPIYWGDPDVKQYYNPQAFINVRDYADLDQLVHVIREIDENDSLWCKYIAEPWQTPEQVKKCQDRMNNYIRFFENVFNSEISQAHRAPSGSMPNSYRNYFFNGIKTTIQKYFSIIRNKMKR